MAAVLTTALGQFFYKKFALNKKKIYLIISVSLFAIVPLFNFIALKEISIDIVYMSTSLTIILVIFLSKVFLNEKVDIKLYSGVLIILLGIIIYNL